MSRLVDLMRTRINKEVFIFLFFLFLSFGYWVLTILKSDIEKELVFELSLVGVPPEYIIADTIPKVLRVTVRDKGRQIASYSHKQSEPLNIPFHNFKFEKSQLSIDNRTLELIVKKELSATVEILSIHPSLLSLECLQVSGKRVPISLVLDYTTSPETMLSGAITLSADSVMVYAPASILRTLNCVYTEKALFRSLSDTLCKRLRLAPLKNTKYEIETVDLVIPVERYTQKIISQLIEVSNIPSGYILRIFPQMVNISCLVPLSRFHSLENDNFVVRLNFNDDLNRQHKKQALQLYEYPEWVINPELDLDSVDVILEKPLN